MSRCTAGFTVQVVVVMVTLFVCQLGHCFQPASVTLQPNNGDETLWPKGFAYASMGMTNMTGERELWIVAGVPAPPSENYSLPFIRIYNTEQNAWTKQVNTTGALIPRFLSPDCGVMLNGTRFVIFGSPAYPTPFDPNPSVYILDLATGVWTEVSAPGGPLAVANPVVVANPVNPDEIIVFGGTSLYNSTVYMGKQLLWSDMHAFNVATSTWRKIDYNTSGSSVVPPGMVYHKGIVVGTDLHIFGGKVCPDGDYSLCPSDPQPLNISYRFDFVSSTWEDLSLISNEMPEPRVGHSLALETRGDQIILFGGSGGANAPLNDIWTYNIIEANWTKIELKYPAPQSSQFQLLYPYAHNQVLVIGGFNPFANPPYMNRVVLVTIGIPDNTTTSQNSTSSTIDNLNVLLSFPNNVPSLTFTPLSKCDRVLDGSKWMRVQVEKLEEMYAVNGDAHLAAVQTVDFLHGTYKVNTSRTGNSQDFNFDRLLGSTHFGFDYSLAEDQIQIDYLGTKFSLAPSDIKLSVSLSDWIWAETFLGDDSPLLLVLRTSLVVYASSPFTALYINQDNSNNQTIYTILSQDVHMTMGFSNLVSSDGQVKRVKLYPYFSQDRVTILIDFPFFAKNLTYDPDFSLLLSTDEGADCSDDSNLVLAIVLPVVLVTLSLLLLLALAAGGFAFYFYRRKRLQKRLCQLSMIQNPDATIPVSDTAL